MVIKILGSGCPKCKFLEQRLMDIRTKNNLEFDIEKVTRIDEIMDYGIMITPGLVIDETIKSYGVIPPEKEILDWIQEAK